MAEPGGRQPFHIALIEPEIPPNTGNIARLCAATETVLHLVGPLGFRINDRELKRSGLDYWDSVRTVRHVSLESFLTALPVERMHFFTARRGIGFTEVSYRTGDILVFGRESSGLPADLLEKYSDQVVTIPMRNAKVRSLNLATAAGIALYEAIRQTDQNQ